MLCTCTWTHSCKHVYTQFLQTMKLTDTENGIPLNFATVKTLQDSSIVGLCRGITHVFTDFLIFIFEKYKKKLCSYYK